MSKEDVQKKASAAEAVHKVAVVRIAAAGRTAWVAAVRIEARPAVADCSLAPAAAEAGYTAVAHSAVDHTEECSPCEKSFLSFFLFFECRIREHGGKHRRVRLF